MDGEGAGGNLDEGRPKNKVGGPVCEDLVRKKPGGDLSPRGRRPPVSLQICAPSPPALYTRPAPLSPTLASPGPN